MNKKPSSKKSETIEVRVSHETKRALQDKCQAQGKTVSGVIRAFIGQYLRQEEHADKPSLNGSMIVNSLIRKPHAFFAACVSLFAAVVVVALSPSSAQDAGLYIDASIVKLDHTREHKNVTRTDMLLSYGNEVSLPMLVDDQQFVFKMTVTPVDADRLMVAVDIMLQNQGETEIVAKPRLMAAYDETVGIMIGNELSDSASVAYQYKIEILPTKL